MIDDLAEVGVRQRVEDDDLIQPVDEFRIEQPLHFLHDGVFHLLSRRFFARTLEAQDSCACSGTGRRCSTS